MAGFKHQGLPGHMVLGAPNLTSTGAGSCTVEMCRQGWELMDRLCPAPTHEPGLAHSSQHVDAFQNPDCSTKCQLPVTAASSAAPANASEQPNRYQQARSVATTHIEIKVQETWTSASCHMSMGSAALAAVCVKFLLHCRGH